MRQWVMLSILSVYTYAVALRANSLHVQFNTKFTHFPDPEPSCEDLSYHKLVMCFQSCNPRTQSDFPFE